MAVGEPSVPVAFSPVYCLTFEIAVDTVMGCVFPPFNGCVI